MAKSSTKRLAAICAIGGILVAPEGSLATDVAEVTKPAVDLSFIPQTAQAAKEAAIALSGGGKRRYEATSVEGCIEEGIVKTYAQFGEEKKKKFLTGTTKDVATSLGSSVVSSLFGSTAGRAVTVGSGALEAKETIEEVKAAQKQVDECIGESIAERKLPVGVLANRREISTADVGIDAARTTASSIPIFGSLFGGGKKKEEAPTPESDQTRITMEKIIEVAKKQEQNSTTR